MGSSWTMSEARGTENRVIGGILLVLGILAVAEARRLYTLRTTLVAGAVVGDDTFPMVVGAALALLGVITLFVARLPVVHAPLPRGVTRARMLGGAAVLVGYWIVLPYLGYTAGTGLVSAALYRVMGGYRWPMALLLAASTTGALYLLFRVWLLQPLPTGLLGF